MSALFELLIDGVAADGRGVGRRDRKVWFVRSAVPGDRVRVAPTRDRGRFGEARVLEWLERSSDRVEPVCPVQSRCGGCPLMSIRLDGQRRWKRRRVLDALVRIGKLADPPLDRVVAAPGADLGYRNRIELQLGFGSGRVSFGFREPGSGERVVPVRSCAVFDARGDRLLDDIRRGLEHALEQAPADGSGVFRVTVRVASGDGRVAIAIRSGRPAERFEHLFAERIVEASSAVAGVVHVTSRRGRGGARRTRLAGAAMLEERLAGTTFELPVDVFTQVHVEAAERLVERVVDAVGTAAGRSIVDLYGGIGVYGWALAGRGAEVRVCEADADAVDAGRKARREGVRAPPTFVRSDAGAFIARELDRGSRPDAIVANPPRSGFAEDVAEGIARLAPDRVVVVSCDPATLARDLARLIRGGYTLERATAIDLFPQTAHVETVAILGRSKQIDRVR